MHLRGYCQGDFRLRNKLAELKPPIDDLDVERFRREVGTPEMEPVELFGDGNLSCHVPPEVCPPLQSFYRSADAYTVKDACGVVLADFGQAFRPKHDESKGRHCSTPFQFQAPEAFFQPNENLSYPSDIWSLASSHSPGERSGGAETPAKMKALCARNHDSGFSRYRNDGTIPLEC
ncbi:uncharacterized protein K489DRAFT_373491 [Dissoconium aciculare CBS 342.82]|uniref:Protein kinase domain-containing protein n=1 Tax=Dissoconium aciculare CBS 342.82 TaxID=1314786 RepID=A0A6J3LYF2_9PEZI|nr:uncharacterized protein K489DRAFT_373491 [Dissoconium aciculare CBS 342.82]KAF1819652.1 hypothetical protein K489DRAFT_373491 [Dissoconium aciculare CBS 342.82]